MTPEGKNNRAGFETYLKLHLPRGKDCAQYSRDLDRKIKQFYKNKLNRDINSIYELTQEVEVFRIKQEIVSHPTMVYMRSRRGDSRIEGLDWYIDYLRTPPTTFTINLPSGAFTVFRRATPDMEGKHIKREQSIIQRNPEARKKCIEYFGYSCAACGLLMSKKYGPLGKDVIEVHHLKPIHEYDDSHPVDYKTDLIPLCPNCHTMIHKLEDPGDLEGLKLIIKDCETNSI